jgi:hypothetical protein
VGIFFKKQPLFRVGWEFLINTAIFFPTKGKKRAPIRKKVPGLITLIICYDAPKIANKGKKIIFSFFPVLVPILTDAREGALNALQGYKQKFG